MNKLYLFFALFRKGSEVADVEKWKSHQISANMLVALLVAVVALARAFGFALPVGDDDLAGIAGGLLAVGNIVVTVISSKRAGLPELPAKPVADLPRIDAVGDGAGPAYNPERDG